jgi:hypothetical protein
LSQLQFRMYQISARTYLIISFDLIFGENALAAR